MDAMQKFLEYASAYDDGSDTRIKLKIIHTQRVTEVMEQLTAARLLSEQDKKLAYLCAVLDGCFVSVSEALAYRV